MTFFCKKKKNKQTNPSPPMPTTTPAFQQAVSFFLGRLLSEHPGQASPSSSDSQPGLLAGPGAQGLPHERPRRLRKLPEGGSFPLSLEGQRADDPEPDSPSHSLPSSCLELEPQPCHPSMTQPGPFGSLNGGALDHELGAWPTAFRVLEDSMQVLGTAKVQPRCSWWHVEDSLDTQPAPWGVTLHQGRGQ